MGVSYGTSLALELVRQSTEASGRSFSIREARPTSTPSRDSEELRTHAHPCLRHLRQHTAATRIPLARDAPSSHLATSSMRRLSRSTSTQAPHIYGIDFLRACDFSRTPQRGVGLIPNSSSSSSSRHRQGRACAREARPPSPAGSPSDVPVGRVPRVGPANVAHGHRVRFELGESEDRCDLDRSNASSRCARLGRFLPRPRRRPRRCRFHPHAGSRGDYDPATPPEWGQRRGRDVAAAHVSVFKGGRTPSSKTSAEQNSCRVPGQLRIGHRPACRARSGCVVSRPASHRCP